MPEFIKTAEIVGTVLQKAHGIGRFLLEQLTLDKGWSNLPHNEQPPANPPVRAHVEYFNSKEE